MEKLQSIIERWLGPIATKLGSNRHVEAVKGGMISSLPIMIVGSVFTILANFPAQAVAKWIEGIGLKPFLSIPVSVTTNILALFVAFFTAYHYSKREEQVDPIHVGLISLISLLILTPLNVTVGESVVAAIPFAEIGAKGLFLGILVGLSVSTLYCYITRKGWTVKMPEGVPENIQKSFSALVPAVVITLLFLAIRVGFSYTSFGFANAFIYKMLQKPLMNIGATPAAVIIVVLLNSLFWFFGIHSLAINAMVMPALVALDLENLAAYELGQALPHISTWRFFYFTTKLGGTGFVIGLCIFMAFWAKSKRFKALGKISLPSTAFNVNEPLIFGMPVMLNPLMLIPFLFVPVITYLISYGAVAIGLVSRINGLQIPMQTPPIISGFLLGGTSFAILQVVLIIIATLLYLPFFKILDKQAAQEEAAAETK